MHHKNIIMCGMKKHQHVNNNGQYEFWRNPHYKKYIEHYGYHFNDHTLKIALEHLENRDETDHCWSKEQVMAALHKMEKKIPKCFSECDATYIANMLYAKFFGSSIKVETSILEMACDVMHDPNHYEGQTFASWLDKIMFKGCVLEWSMVI